MPDGSLQTHQASFILSHSLLVRKLDLRPTETFVLASHTALAEYDPNNVVSIIRELSEPLAAIVSNAQAGQRMGGVSGVDPELMEVLSDIAGDGKRAGELLRQLDTLLASQ